MYLPTTHSAWPLIFEMRKTFCHLAGKQNQTPHAAGTAHTFHDMQSIFQIKHYKIEERNEAWAVSTQRELDENFYVWHNEKTSEKYCAEYYAQAIQYLNENYITLNANTLPLFDALRQKASPDLIKDRGATCQHFSNYIKLLKTAKEVAADNCL
jgi:hypothetical protein